MKNRGRLAPCLAAALSIALPSIIGCLPPDSSGALGTAGASASAGTGGYAGTGPTTGAAGTAGTMAVSTGRGGSVATTGAAGGGTAGTTGGIAGTTGSIAGSRGGAGDAPGGHGGGAATGLAGAGGMGGHAGMAGGGGRAGTGGSAGGTSVPPTFTQIYKTILMVYCQGSECHNPGTQRNVSFATQAKAYTSARALITAGSAKNSTFYNEVYTGAMPPIGDALSESQIKMIADWIDAGAMNN